MQNMSRAFARFLLTMLSQSMEWMETGLASLSKRWSHRKRVMNHQPMLAPLLAVPHTRRKCGRDRSQGTSSMAQMRSLLPYCDQGMRAECLRADQFCYGSAHRSLQKSLAQASSLGGHQFAEKMVFEALRHFC